MNRFRKLDILSLQEVEQEIDLLISLAGDEPDDRVVDEVTKLIRLANALGTKRKW
jgi:hypothetical protein